ncbi:hypothetical protein [Verrucosispora sioxanthis]|uniref:hypothetical protein n=1 Tax=Verrucosispora sioxanthis TaxID=2499994 RepID=UPI001F15E704|nr:hypothetical protein [Verrucosispora sioxanthis]
MPLRQPGQGNPCRDEVTGAHAGLDPVGLEALCQRLGQTHPVDRRGESTVSGRGVGHPAGAERHERAQLQVDPPTPVVVEPLAQSQPRLGHPLRHVEPAAQRVEQPGQPDLRGRLGAQQLAEFPGRRDVPFGGRPPPGEQLRLAEVFEQVVLRGLVAPGCRQVEHPAQPSSGPRRIVDRLPPDRRDRAGEP